MRTTIFYLIARDKEVSFGGLELDSETCGFIYFNMVMVLVSHVYQIGLNLSNKTSERNVHTLNSSVIISSLVILSLLINNRVELLAKDMIRLMKRRSTIS